MIEVWTSEKVKLSFLGQLQRFLSSQSMRLVQGQCRYGEPDRRKKYMTRLGMELKAYKKTGNREHLLNIANYAFLESIEPENRRFHWDNEVGSATKGKV